MTLKRAIMSSVIGLVFACLLVFATSLRSGKVMRTFPKPSAVDYGADYTLAVVRADRIWNPFDLSWRYEVSVGRTENVGVYGHVVPFAFGRIESIDAQLSHATVTWDDKGVTFGDALGQRLFIPKALFVGGR